MKRTLPTTVTLLALGLAGCYTAEQPWLDDSNSVAPYETISFAEQDSDEVNVLTRSGSTYVVSEEGVTLTMRFMPIADHTDWYVTEVTAEDSGEVTRLYAVMNLDNEAMTASTYSAIALDNATGPGLHVCDDMVCIDDLDAYVAHAFAGVDGGAEPDAVYNITLQ